MMEFVNKVKYGVLVGGFVTVAYGLSLCGVCLPTEENIESRNRGYVNDLVSRASGCDGDFSLEDQGLFAMYFGINRSFDKLKLLPAKGRYGVDVDLDGEKREISALEVMEYCRNHDPCSVFEN